MRNPELDYYRAAIGQILADAGINRNTIQELVKQAIQEKVEKEVNQHFHRLIQTTASRDYLVSLIRDSLRGQIREELRTISIGVTIENQRGES